jgi:hypothetical protein
MNMLFAKRVTDKLWKDIYDVIVEHDVKFLVGDWNMSLPQVVPRLTEFGLHVECCSWYPWLHKAEAVDGFHLGMDSVAMFYIGGDVVCDLKGYGFHNIGEILREAASAPSTWPRSRPDGVQPLDVFTGQNTPGKPWHCFKSKHKEAKKGRVPLQQKLEGLLAPSTSQERLYELWANLNREDGKRHAHLQLKQKPTSLGEWLLNPATGQVHKGAHKPLLMFTDNGSGRSKEADAKRKAGKRGSQTWGARPMAPANSRPLWLTEGVAVATDDAVAVAADGAWRPSRWVRDGDGGWQDWSEDWSSRGWSSGWSRGH